MFTFDVTAGEEYVITMNSTDFDVYFYVLSGSDIVAFDDDSNGSYNAKVVYTPINSGSLSLHATSYHSSATGSYTMEIAHATAGKTAQTLSFGTAPTLTVGGTGVISATASSGLSPVYSSVTPSVCTVANAMVTGVSAGICKILAEQAGDDRYHAAPTVSQSFTLEKNTQTLSFGTAPTLTVGGTGGISATASSGLSPVYSSVTPSVCTVANAMVTGVSAGICTILAEQAGDDQYQAAPSVTQSFTLEKNTQTLSFGAAPTLTVGGTGGISATASSGLSPVYSSVTP
ncbi:MAG: PPC domain-containing protein, partial [Methylovulum sp.]|nr:PPC domain-containing protein [Methylovulum sp.]